MKNLCGRIWWRTGVCGTERTAGTRIDLPLRGRCRGGAVPDPDPAVIDLLYEQEGHTETERLTLADRDWPAGKDEQMRMRCPRHPALLAVGAALVLMASSCSSPPAPPAPTAPIPTAGSSPVQPSAAPLGTPTTRPLIAAGVLPSKVLVVIEENRTTASALAGMPFLASLAGAYGQARNYQAVTHPSLPNYLAIVGGSTFGVTDDQPPARHPIGGASVFDGALAAGSTAKTYAEAMPEPCAATSSGRYAVKHNPWAYFSYPVARANCHLFDLPAGTPTGGNLHDDVLAGTLPTLGLLIPDLCNDGHDCPLATADGWLGHWIPAIMQGPDYQAGRLAIVVTFDEDDSKGPNTVLTTVVAPNTTNVTSQDRLTHYSLTRYLADLAGTPPPGEAGAAPSLRDAFDV